MSDTRPGGDTPAAERGGAPGSETGAPPDPVAAPVLALVDRLTDVVTSARAMPMSASCIVNRDEVLGLLQDLRAELPQALERASALVADREQVLAEARQEAARVLQDAREERKALLAKSEVHKAAQAEARRLVAEAQAEADETRAEVEDYVDSKLANFEVVLERTLAAVQRGRARLHGETEHDELAEPEPDAKPGNPKPAKTAKRPAAKSADKPADGKTAAKTPAKQAKSPGRTAS